MRVKDLSDSYSLFLKDSLGRVEGLSHNVGNVSYPRAFAQRNPYFPSFLDLMAGRYVLPYDITLRDV